MDPAMLEPRAKSYIERLKVLDSLYRKRLAECRLDTIVVVRKNARLTRKKHAILHVLIETFLGRENSVLWINAYFARAAVSVRGTVARRPDEKGVDVVGLGGQRNIFCQAVHDAAPFWNKKPPISTVTFLDRNMDKFTQVITILSSYMEPVDNYSYLKKMHYMNGTWDDALWRPTPRWTANAPLDYVYPSNPGIIGGDSELQTGGHYVTDREGVGTSGPSYFGQGDVLEYELAYHFSYASDSGYFQSIDQALDEVSQLLRCYQNDSVPGGRSFSLIPESEIYDDADVQIYPNPVYAYLNIMTNSSFETYRIFNAYGQLVDNEKFTKHIFIGTLQNGIYFLQLLNENGDVSSTLKFIKQ